MNEEQLRKDWNHIIINNPEFKLSSQSLQLAYTSGFAEARKYAIEWWLIKRRTELSSLIEKLEKHIEKHKGKSNLDYGDGFIDGVEFSVTAIKELLK